MKNFDRIIDYLDNHEIDYCSPSYSLDGRFITLRVQHITLDFCAFTGKLIGKYT